MGNLVLSSHLVSIPWLQASPRYRQSIGNLSWEAQMLLAIWQSQMVNTALSLLRFPRGNDISLLHGTSLTYIHDDYTTSCQIHLVSGSDDKEPACNLGDLGSILEFRRFPGEGNWQPTPVFLSGESHRERSLASCGLQSRKESNMTEQLALSL